MLDYEAFDVFCVFAKAQLASWDIDPMYPVLRSYYTETCSDNETALWRTVLYVTWYHVGSASSVWDRHPTPRKLLPSDVSGLPTGVERRGFRGNTLAIRFVNGLLDAAGGNLCRWVADAVGDGGERGWDCARAALGCVPYAGPWATYKWADLLKHVHGYNVAASSIGDKLGETSGPIPGMVRLTGLPWSVCARDTAAQRVLLEKAVAAGVGFTGLDQLETALCDYNSLCKGGYYVGHDIDAQMTQLGGPASHLWQHRSVFPTRYRGELGGWDGVRKELKRLFTDKGLLVNT